jgi:hypothetical protein
MHPHPTLSVVNLGPGTFAMFGIGSEIAIVAVLLTLFKRRGWL